MLSLSILVSLTIFLYIWLKRISAQSLIEADNNYRRFQYEYERKMSDNIKLKDKILVLEKTAADIAALYDITREICKYLDEDKVFNNFLQQLNRYINVSDCKLIKNKADLLPYNNYTVFPLTIDKDALGYLVADRIKEEEKEKFQILAQQFLLGFKRALLYQKVQTLAITDSLTGAFSRRYLMERLNEEIARSKKFKYNFSFLMVDIDYFKDYNDRYGHLVGDAILREISQLIKENIRQIDLVGRYGGEEFSIILTETDKEGARFVAERLRQAIEHKRIRIYDEDLNVTLSIGVSTFPEDAQDAQVLNEQADQALYQAKHLGRNRVCVA